MKFSQILPFVAVSSAFVIPSEEVLNEIQYEDNHRGSGSWYDDAVSTKDHLKEVVDEAVDASKHAWNDVVEYSSNVLDEAFDKATEAKDTVVDKYAETSSDVHSWLDTEYDEIVDTLGHHGHHPSKPNMTVYQLIAESKYTTILAKLISEYDDLVEALNSTKANYTVFAPTDKAFEKLPKPDHKPSKEQVKALLSYHVVPDFYPAKRVLLSHTAPTLLKGEHLANKPVPQRIAFRLGLRGPTVNFISRIVAVNIFGTNGVIHGVDTPIFPPIGAIREIDLFPGTFSTLELGLGKTGLLEELNSTNHPGGTFFAPDNFAFQKLGPKVNAFLFSQYGAKYLKALLQYHVVPANTLYSDAYYKGESSKSSPTTTTTNSGFFHVDLPTMLKDRSIGVDIAKYGPFTRIKVNAFADVAVADGIAEDGVVHVMGDVIIPPKKLGSSGEVSFWQGGELTVEDLMERLEPFVESKWDL